MRTGVVAAVAALALGAPSLAKAAVKVEERTQLELGGLLGKMASLVAPQEAQPTRTVAVAGARKMVTDGKRGEIIDLGEDKVYALDLEHRTYAVTSFEQVRRRIEEARRTAAETRRRPEQGAATAHDADPRMNELLSNLELEVDVRNTGRTRRINGFDTHEVVMSITAHEKGKAVDESGGLALTSAVWLAPRIAALEELNAFDQRHARRIASVVAEAWSADRSAVSAAMASFPMLQDAMARMRTEGAKLEGSPILTTVAVEVIQSAEQLAQERERESRNRPKLDVRHGLGGLLGSVATKAVAQEVERRTAPSQRATLMKMTTEVLRVSTVVPASELAVPDGFRLVR